MKLLVIQKTYGVFVVHSPECPIIERDRSQDATGLELEADVNSRYQLAQDVADALEIKPNLLIYVKRFLCHSLTIAKKDVCTAERLPLS